MDFFMSLLQQAKDANVVFQFLGVLLVAAVPFLEAYVAAPVGIAIGFPFWVTVAAAVIGNWVSVAAVVLVSDRLQQWMQRRREAKHGGQGDSRRMQRASQLFAKYGVPGVAFIGPLLVGNHIGAFISIVSGASRRYVLLWQTISIVVWAVGTGLLVSFGVDVIQR